MSVKIISLYLALFFFFNIVTGQQYIRQYMNGDLKCLLLLVSFQVALQ